MFTCICVCDPQRFGFVGHDLTIREYKHGVHNALSAPVDLSFELRHSMHSFPSGDVL